MNFALFEKSGVQVDLLVALSNQPLHQTPRGTVCASAQTVPRACR
jgi:hypothetical protein